MVASGNGRAPLELLRCSDKTSLFIPFSQPPDYWILFHFKRSIPLRFARSDSHGDPLCRPLIVEATYMPRVRAYIGIRFKVLHSANLFFRLRFTRNTGSTWSEPTLTLCGRINLLPYNTIFDSQWRFLIQSNKYKYHSVLSSSNGTWFFLLAVRMV